MKKPPFEHLSVKEVLDLHAKQLERYGGADGVRDFGLLESAVNAPQASFGGQYCYEDIFDAATAYFFGLSMNHPFLDGNKRTATNATLLFLSVNGLRFLRNYNDLTEKTLALVERRIERQDFADFLRENSVEI